MSSGEGESGIRPAAPSLVSETTWRCSFCPNIVRPGDEFGSLEEQLPGGGVALWAMCLTCAALRSATAKGATS